MVAWAGFERGPFAPKKRTSRPICESSLIPSVELEITPEPDEAEREAIVAALEPTENGPSPYASGWRAAGLEEPLDEA